MMPRPAADMLDLLAAANALVNAAKARQRQALRDAAADKRFPGLARALTLEAQTLDVLVEVPEKGIRRFKLRKLTGAIEANMTYSLGRLVQAGLVTIRKSRKDRREVVVTPTSAGNAVKYALRLAVEPPLIGDAGDRHPRLKVAYEKTVKALDEIRAEIDHQYQGDSYEPDETED